MYISFLFFFFKQKTAYEMRISDWSSDVCSSDLRCCARYVGCRQIAVRSGAVLDDDRLAHLLRHPLGEQPADEVSAAARRARHNDGNRLRREILRGNRCRREAGQHHCRRYPLPLRSSHSGLLHQSSCLGDTGAFAPLALVALAFAALGRRAAAPVSSTRPSAQPSCAKAAWAVMVTRPAALVAQSSTPSPFVAPQAVKSAPSTRLNSSH